MSPSPEKRAVVRLPRAERMHQIESAARKLFHKHGYTAARISEIAADAGISEAAIYKFYSNKRDLLHTLLKDWYMGMLDDFYEKLEGVEGARNRIKVIIWQHLKSIRECPDLCRLFYSEVRSMPDYYDTELYELNRRYTLVLVDVVKTGIASGELRPDTSSALVRDVIFGGIEHRVTPFLMGRSDIDIDEMSTQLCDLVCQGICTPDAGQDMDRLMARLERVADRLDGKAKGG